MAARKALTHLQRTRDKIQASMLIKRLEDCVNGKVELSGPQVTAALGLIKKVVPDLSSVTMDGEVDHNVKVSGSLSWQPPQ